MARLPNRLRAAALPAVIRSWRRCRGPIGSWIAHRSLRRRRGGAVRALPRAQGPSLLGAIERCAFEAGTDLRLVATAARVHTQLAIVAGGVGIGLVTESTTRTLAFSGVRFVPIEDTREHLFPELAVAADRELTAAVEVRQGA